MPKLRALTESPPLARGDAEDQLAELRDYLIRVIEELSYLLTHLEADNINDSTFEKINEMIPKAYRGMPLMDGEGAPGQSEQWSPGDHQHKTDTSRAAASDLTAHVEDTTNPHSVTKAQVGLGNVADERQYSANNPPPYPVTRVNGETGDVVLDASDVGALSDAATLDDIPDGTTYAKATAAQVAQIGVNQAAIASIEGKVPSAASSSNQLADKDFVTDSITQGTAIFRGSFATKAALLAVQWQTVDPSAANYVSNNDYAVVLDDETQSDECWRYIYVTGIGWTAQYRINESPLTQAQLDALNSGATAAIISSVAGKLDANGDGSDVTAAFTAASERANIGTGEKLTVLFGKIAKWFADLGTAAFRAATGTLSSGSTDLAEAGAVYTGLDGKQDTITASGILKGNGSGGVSAAAAGTDYQAPLTAGTDYATPGMIPSVPSAYTSNPAMDGTASPGSSGAWAKGDHVHPSDSTKANETELAYVESGSTASRAYAVGEYFCLGGKTCRVKTAINSGATLTLNTNYEEVPGGGLNSLKNSLPLVMKRLNTSSGTTATITFDFTSSLYVFPVFVFGEGYDGRDTYAAIISIYNNTVIKVTNFGANTISASMSGLTLTITTQYSYATLNILGGMQS